MFSFKINRQFLPFEPNWIFSSAKYSGFVLMGWFFRSIFSVKYSSVDCFICVDLSRNVFSSRFFFTISVKYPLVAPVAVSFSSLAPVADTLPWSAKSGKTARWSDKIQFFSQQSGNTKTLSLPSDHKSTTLTGESRRYVPVLLPIFKIVYLLKYTKVGEVIIDIQLCNNSFDGWQEFRRKAN